MKAEELDKKFDDGKDVLDLFDLTSLKRPALKIQSVSAKLDLQEFLSILGNKPKINIIGSPGSGKSTLAKIISQQLDVPIYDLDVMFYDESCNLKNNDERINFLSNISQCNSLIIDGTYSSSFESRLLLVDTVVLVENSTARCLYNFFRRLLYTNNLKCGERFTFKTFVLILQFNFIIKNILIQTALKYNKKVYIYKDQKFSFAKTI
jgi:adenylate kinase family enzyme